MTTGTRSVRRGNGFANIAVVSPHDTNELTNYAEAIQASADCTADIVTSNGQTVAGFFFLKGINRVSVKVVKNNVSNSATLWALW